MSLIYCPNCRNKMSEFSTVCPNCKNEVLENNNENVDKNSLKNVYSENKQKQKKWLIILLCVLALPAGLLIGVIGDKMKSNKRKQQIESQENYTNTRSENSSSSSTSSKNTRTVYSGGYAVQIDLTPPAGYEEGSTCVQCDGGGVTSYNGSDMICPSCNGKGFNWRKK